MSVAVHARYFVEDGAALADALSLRFRNRPLILERASSTYSPRWQIPPLAMPSWSVVAVGNKRKIAAAIIALGVCAALLAYSWTLFPELVALRDRMGGIVVTDAAGVEGGLLLRVDGLTTRRGDGKIVPRVSLPVKSVSRDFIKAGQTLEGQGVLGVSPVNMARAAVCSAFQSIGFHKITPLRLKDDRCNGGSTLAAIAVRSLTDKRKYGIGRKLDEVMSTISLSLHLKSGSDAHSRFISDTAFFGYARGLPLFGVRATAQANFGKDENLALHESALLASMLLYPVELNCGQPQKSALARFDQIRNRAIYALDRGFRNDPRYSAERELLVTMPAITSPAAAPEALSAGLDRDAACRAGGHPALKFEALDSTARLASMVALSKLGHAANDVREMRLSTSFQAQARFKAQIDKALHSIAVQQRGHWNGDPSGSGVVALAFASDAHGTLTALYESTSDSQLYRERELGSLAKIPALIFLSEQGWSVTDQFCNKASPPYSNAGGDRGVKSCDGDRGLGLMNVDEVMGRSISLAVMDALRRYPPALLTKRMAELGITLPKNVEPAYAVAFGLARTSPARMQAIFAAVSFGVSGSKPVGREPSIVVSYRTADGSWHKPLSTAVDLSAAFTSADGRTLISRGTIAAYGPQGTLAALGPAVIGSVGKTGTLDTAEPGSVRLKTAAGAWAGRGWFVMAVPRTGALGDSSISIMPLARSARDAMMHRYVTQVR
jgi:Transglycosylase